MSFFDRCSDFEIRGCTMSNIAGDQNNYGTTPVDNRRYFDHRATRYVTDSYNDSSSRSYHTGDVIDHNSGSIVKHNGASTGSFFGGVHSKQKDNVGNKGWSPSHVASQEEQQGQAGPENPRSQLETPSPSPPPMRERRSHAREDQLYGGNPGFSQRRGGAAPYWDPHPVHYRLNTAQGAPRTVNPGPRGELYGGDGVARGWRGDDRDEPAASRAPGSAGRRRAPAQDEARPGPPVDAPRPQRVPRRRTYADLPEEQEEAHTDADGELDAERYVRVDDRRAPRDEAVPQERPPPRGRQVPRAARRAFAAPGDYLHPGDAQANQRAGYYAAAQRPPEASFDAGRGRGDPQRRRVYIEREEPLIYV